MLCFYVIIQQERLFKVSAICLSHFFTWFLSDPFLPACRHIPHSALSCSPTHSSISVFSLSFTALCSFYLSFGCYTHTHTHRPTACYTTLIQSSSLSVCSHLPVGRAAHNSAIKSLKNVKHRTVCEFLRRIFTDLL